MQREEIKWNYIKCSIKTRKGRKIRHKNLKKEKWNEEKTLINMVDIGPTILIVTLNVNGLNTSIKKTETIREDKKP